MSHQTSTVHCAELYQSKLNHRFMIHERSETLEEKHRFTRAIVINRKLNTTMRKHETRITSQSMRCHAQEVERTTLLARSIMADMP
jgi:hypothetical protein